VKKSFETMLNEKQEAYTKVFEGKLLEVKWYDKTIHIFLAKEVIRWACVESVNQISWGVRCFDLTTNRKDMIMLTDKEIQKAINQNEIFVNSVRIIS
jgi:hypothetical protein